jgi:hypothetical protein
MALNSTDLFVVQSQSNKALYKLSLNDLQAAVEGGSGINFRGSVDLLSALTGQIDPDPAVNGDMYVVEQDAATINASWTMAGGVTAADKNDRVIWDSASSSWILVAGGSNTGGTVTEVIGTDPIQVDMASDPTKPVVSIDQATTTSDGSVERLATAADVVHTNLNPSNTAVVTSDLLRATNKILDDLALSPGGVVSVSTDNTNLNDALTIAPTSGAVKVEIRTADDTQFGVTSVASAQDIIDGTAGAGAVVTSAQLKAVSDSIPEEADFGVLTLTEGGTDIVSGALDITNTAGDVTIGIKDTIFVPADFDSLPDITA